MAGNNQFGTLSASNDPARRNNLYSTSLSMNKLQLNPTTGKSLTASNYVTKRASQAAGTPVGILPLNYNQNPINVANPAIRRNLGPLPNIPKAQRKKPKKFVQSVAASYDHRQDPASTYNTQDY